MQDVSFCRVLTEWITMMPWMQVSPARLQRSSIWFFLWLELSTKFGCFLPSFFAYIFFWQGCLIWFIYSNWLITLFGSRWCMNYDHMSDMMVTTKWEDTLICKTHQTPSWSTLHHSLCFGIILSHIIHGTDPTDHIRTTWMKVAAGQSPSRLA